jgi:formylglycine-generating enzyme required for sulfatase activity
VRRFALAKYEVTIGEFMVYVAANKLPTPALWEGAARDPEQPQLPMTLVNREQAAGYCRWRYGQWNGRLPTEAEWEFAARDGRSERRYPWPGKQLDESKVNAGRGQLMAVRSLPEGTTDLGLLHMLGNAAEWTTAEVRKKGDAGPGVDWGVVRGGGADTPSKGLTVASRTLLPADGRYPFVGFRCAARAP